MVNLTNISHRILLQQQPKDHQTLPMKQSGMLLPCTKVLLLILTMSIPISRSITISRGKSLAKKIKSTSFLSTQQQLLVRFPTSSFHKGSNIMMMPEGPEVRTLVDQLQPGVGLRLCDLHFVSGRYTRHGKPKGFEEFKETMTYHKSKESVAGIDHVTSWNAKGKFIWLTLDDGMKQLDTAKDSGIDDKKGGSDNDDDNDYLRSIWITLGMSGRFVSNAFHESNSDDDGTAHNQPRWYFEFLDENNDEEEKNKPRRIYYYDTRNFGTLRFSLSKKELDEKLNCLGPDILIPGDCTEEIFLDVMSRQRKTMNICRFLMNQSKIAGVGNYLLAEALYRSNLDPYASLEEIDTEQRKRLYKEVIETANASYMQQGMTRKGGSYKDINGNKGNFAFSLQCYGRETCAKGRKVVRDTNGPHGRTIWYVEDQLLMPLAARNLSSSSKDTSSNDTTSEDELPASSQELAKSLNDESWKYVLTDFLSSEKFQRLSDFVSSERQTQTVYPPTQDVFAALNMCPFENVQVVIIGQDPYHGPNQGHGLAFSVQRGIKIPPSLRNIFKELNNDLGVSIPDHGNLESWARQGVLLLNTVLTVRAGEANSHSNMGWEDFTSEIVEKLNDEKKGLVFLLWGAPAAKKCSKIDVKKHVVIKTSHPSPLGAAKTSSPFLGSKCFSRCNDALSLMGHDVIDWEV